MLQQVNDTTRLLAESPKSKRVISKSTGLAKFNITNRLAQNDQLNHEFVKLETAVHLRSSKSGLNLKHRGHTIVYSPQSSPTREKACENDNLHQLASKQRELLEYRQQLEQLKKKIEFAEQEVVDLQRTINNEAAAEFTSPLANPFTSPPRQSHKSLSKSTSISQLRPLNQSQSTMNFTSLKKKLSIQQLNTKQSISKFNYNLNQDMNQNFKNLTKDTNQLIEKGLSFVNNIRMELKQTANPSSERSLKYRYNNSSGDYDSDSDGSNYGSADTSDYGLPVK